MKEIIIFVIGKGFIKFDLDKGVIEYTLNPKESEIFETVQQVRYCTKVNQIQDYMMFNLPIERE